MIALPHVAPSMVVNIVLAVLLLGFVGSGYRDGFVYTLGRLVGAVLGYVLARMWSAKLAVYLVAVMPSSWAKLAAFVVIFLVVGRLVGFIFKLLDGVFRLLALIPFLSTINGILGAVLGIAEGVLILGGLVWIFGKYHPVPAWQAPLDASIVAKELMQAFRLVTRIFSPITDLL